MSKLLTALLLAMSLNAYAIDQQRAIELYGTCEEVSAKFKEAEKHYRALNVEVDFRDHYSLIPERAEARREYVILKLQQQDVCDK